MSRRALDLLRHLGAAKTLAAECLTSCIPAKMTSTITPAAVSTLTPLRPTVVSNPIVMQTRSTGSLPDDLTRAARKARFPASSRAAHEPTTSTTSATSATSTEEVVDEATAKLHREQQDVVSNFMFPWERRQMQGGALSTWEQWYWGVFVLAIAIFLFNRSGSWINSEEELEKAAAEKRRQEEMERLQLERARRIMTGGSVLVGDDEDDPFEDMSPEDIEKFVQTHTGGSTQDPFAGMTPDEIDAYVKEHNL